MGNNGGLIPVHCNRNAESYSELLPAAFSSLGHRNDPSWNMELSVSSGYGMRYESRISSINKKIHRQLVSILFFFSLSFLIVD